MHTLSIPQLKFSYAFCSKKSTTRCGVLWRPETDTVKWKKGSKEDNVLTTANYFVGNKERCNDARRDGTNLPRVCAPDDYSVRGDIDKCTMEDSINYIKNILSSMDDGQISVSPYDTAWIALIKDLSGRNIPQFPSSLEWIAQNQLSDGSWGDEHFFLAYDRLLNTLACVIALRSWNVHTDKSEKGISFIKDNIIKLEDATIEHMTSGFELVFPSLLQRARDLGIDGIPHDELPVIQAICAARDRKMKRVPKELMHKVPTCLLHHLEGLEGHDWRKLLKLQTPKGTFLTSPAATSFAVMETQDENCLTYIKYIVNKFNGGAPMGYPVDIFARLWAVDRLQRLGISRFFKPEIKDCLDYIYRFWTEKGLFSAKESEFCDIDDTSMGFRLLRLHGYDITPNALKNFKQGDEFTCYVGQAFESPSPIFNFYRASQVLFPGEKILEEANNFSFKFLKERLQSNQLLDKWLISKHLPNEIKHGLEMPWYSSLPRVETRFYIENYGVDDIWIGKSLYRMPEINNEVYLQLARLDYNKCQEQHQMELKHMQQWYEDHNLGEFGISKKCLILAYFLTTSSIFEQDRSIERIAWFQSQIVCNMITCYFNNETIPLEQKTAFLEEFRGNIHGRGQNGSYKVTQRLVIVLLETLQQLIMDTKKWIDTDISHQLHDTWEAWLMKLHKGVAEKQEIEVIVSTINICAGRIVSKETKSHIKYQILSKLTSKICQQLEEYRNAYTSFENSNVNFTINSNKIKYKEIEEKMQSLVQLVLHEFNNISIDTKQTFLMVAKTFYYRAYYKMENIDFHLSKVLFEKV